MRYYGVVKLFERFGTRGKKIVMSLDINRIDIAAAVLTDAVMSSPSEAREIYKAMKEDGFDEDGAIHDLVSWVAVEEGKCGGNGRTSLAVSGEEFDGGYATTPEVALQMYEIAKSQNEEEWDNVKESLMHSIDSMIDRLLGEAVKSSAVQKILDASNAKKILRELSAAIGPVKWDEVDDTDFVPVPLVGKSVPLDLIVFWLTDKEKKNPYAARWGSETLPANLLLAITKGTQLLPVAASYSRYPKDKFGRAGDSYEGLSSLKRVRELADIAFAIPEEKLKGVRSAEPVRATRYAARKGATALISDKDFREMNKNRYQKLLQQKHADDDVVDSMRKIIDVANKIQDNQLVAARSGELFRGDYGRSIASNAQEKVSNAWYTVESILGYVKELAVAKAKYPDRDKEDFDFYISTIKEKKLELKGILNKLEAMLSKISTQSTPTPEVESLQISPRQFGKAIEEVDARPSARPLKTHAELADRFLEVRKAIDDLSQQANAIKAIISQKEQVSAQMAQDLLRYAEEYKDRSFKTKRILVQLEDIPAHKAQVPQWQKVMNFMLGKLEAISQDLKKEAEAFIEGAKREIPGSTELRYKELESVTSSVAESWIIFRKMFDKIKEWASVSRAKINNLQDMVSDLLSTGNPSEVEIV